jgi:hypothetical protein
MSLLYSLIYQHLRLCVVKADMLLVMAHLSLEQMSAPFIEL